MLGITVRGGTKVPDRDYEYAKLKLVSCMQRGADVASGLRTGHLPRPPGERQFRQIGATEGIAYWLTSGAVGIESGLMMTLSRPSETSPTASPSSAAAAVTAAARKVEKKFRSTAL